MNGVHDMGGDDCHGAINREGDDVLFHHEWERRVLGMTLGCGGAGAWNLDQSRFARETVPPAYYLSAGYYRIWLAGLEKLLLERGMVTSEELQDYRMREAPVAQKRVIQADEVPKMLAAGAPVDRPATAPALFKVGDRIRVRNHQPVTHTRLPAYIRGHVGEIVEVHGCHIYPDEHSLGKGENPHWLYNVEFSADDLWGDQGQGGMVMVDCWEPYLESLSNLEANSAGGKV